eukprot:197702_1
MNNRGVVVGGDKSCGHIYVQINNLTNVERHWLRMIDVNKEENERHTKQFEGDILHLNNFKEMAMAQMTEKIKELRDKLNARQKQIQDELTKVFEQRRDKIYENIEALNDCKLKNEKTKESSEEMLQQPCAVCDEKELQREKTIVDACKNIINNSPNLHYIETQLHIEFKQLDDITREISQFGKLIQHPIDSGEKCQFKSCSDALPKQIAIPWIQITNSTYDRNKEQVKLSFEIIEEIDIMEHLQICVSCVYDDEDDKEDELNLIHEQISTFRDCTRNGEKWELYVDKRFNPGMTIAFKLKPKFKSPNAQTFADSDGKWSMVQIHDIPEIPEEKGAF